MPVNQLVNPLAEEGESAGYGAFLHYMEYDSTQSGNVQNGTLMVIQTTTSATFTGPFLVRPSTTTASASSLGIAASAPTGGYVPGASVGIVTEGIVQALFAASTTAGHYALSGTGTAGTLVDSSTVTAGLTIGVILQSLTISSGTALVWIYMHRM